MRTFAMLLVFVHLIGTALRGAEPAAPTGELQQLAFPGAEGFGRLARGGRGGDVFEVTGLADDGPGSLREAIRTAVGPRTIVFRVSGTIVLESPLLIDKSFLTIAGQSAPGDGICLSNQTVRLKNVTDVVMRYVRVRLGDENKPADSGPDCLNTDDVDRVIFDHISASWGIDSNHDLRRGGNFTLQWSIYAEALNHSTHGKGAHAMLASFRDLTGGISLHHNLLASSRERHPTLAGGAKTNSEAVVDFRDNVVYNLSGATNLGNCRINVVNNYYLSGPDTPRDSKPLAVKTETMGALLVYLAGNQFVGNDAATRDNWRAVDFERWSKGNYRLTSAQQIRVDAAWPVGEALPTTQPADEAYLAVLAQAGASHVRDAADERLVRGVEERTHRLIDSQSEVGGWPKLAGATPPADQDHDGMSDVWESAHGLNASDPTDRNSDRDADGFTNLEEYLNGLCAPVK